MARSMDFFRKHYHEVVMLALICGILAFLALDVLGLPVPKLVIRKASGEIDSVNDFGKTLHSSAALGALTLLYTMHKALSSSGFILTRGVFSTDVLISLGNCALSVVWLALVIVSAFFVGDTPCRDGKWHQCLGRLAFVPWIFLVMSGTWVVWFLDALRHEKVRKQSIDRVGLWQANMENGPFDWRSGMAPWFLFLTYALILAASGVTAYGAVKNDEYTIAILNLTGLILVTIDAGGNNPYITAPHRYKADNIRMVLTTTHSSQTVYILPSRKYGFDAIHSPKITYEHLGWDKLAVSLFGTLWDRANGASWSAFETMFKMRTLAQEHNKNVVHLSDPELTDLAHWLYWDVNDEKGNGPDVGKMRTLLCERTPNTHLIGRELAMVLMFTEYMLFEFQERNSQRLPEHLHQAWKRLRSPKFSGATQAKEKHHQVGFIPGKPGYQEAVRYVYGIFGMKDAEEAALNPTGNPPKFSAALRCIPKSMDDYIGQLWDLAQRSETTTFGALYLFTGVWYMEIGNVRGFHLMPFRPLNESKQGDITVWEIIWRQAWYTAVVSQLVTMSPTIINAFLGGVLV